MNRGTPGLPVHHRLLESTQPHVHRVGDAFPQECSNIMALFLKYPFNFISQFLFVGQNHACSDYVGEKMSTNEVRHTEILRLGMLSSVD